jgi:DNA-binding response OmpR family regulator
MNALLIHRQVVESVVCAIRLGWDGAVIRQVRSRNEALKCVVECVPDLVAVDESLPDVCPLALTRDLRRLIDSVIIIVTRDYDEYQLAAAVDAGADDYLSLPVNPAVFVPRIRAAMRRAPRLSEEPINLGALEVDPSRHQVQVAGRNVRLAASEFKVLLELARLRGRVATRDLLAGAIWGHDRDVYSPWLRKYIQSLRRRVCELPGSDVDIVTVPKVGYKLVATHGALAEA